MAIKKNKADSELAAICHSAAAVALQKQLREIRDGVRNVISRGDSGKGGAAGMCCEFVLCAVQNSAQFCVRANRWAGMRRDSLCAQDYAHTENINIMCPFALLQRVWHCVGSISCINSTRA